MTKLGVNIDHVATLRQARRGIEPEPLWAAAAAELAGADGVTVHLREDRRHIQDRDVRLLRQAVQSRLNLEMAVAEEIVGVALDLLPHQATLVPEKREEVTTEGGLDVAGAGPQLASAVERLKAAGVQVNLFVDPDPAQIEAASKLGADGIELHTGQYALAADGGAREACFAAICAGAAIASNLGLYVAAGHGLNYSNVIPVAALSQVEELNIGHSIMSRAIFTGLEKAVREMKALMAEADRAAGR